MSETGGTAAARREAAVRAFTQAAIHLEGRGIPQDVARAAQLFRLAAELGHAKAQFNLGLMYARGLGVAADPQEAERWLRAAAAAGEAKATLALQQLGAAAPPVPAAPHRAPETVAAVPASAAPVRRGLPAWAIPAAAGGAVVALTFVAWPFAREQFFPPRDLAELGARCEMTDPYGQRVAFRATALPAAFKVSATEACELARTMTEQHRAEQDAVLDQLCGTLDGIVREFGAGDYDRAARTLAQRFGASDPQARPALALIAKCRTPAARAAASEDVRKEVAARNARLAVYSVGQFVHDGRMCRGYVEEFSSDQGSKTTQPWGVGYELRGYGDCAQVRIDAKQAFNPVRNPGGPLKGDLYRDALKYDGALPATFSYRGATYNFASARGAAVPPPRHPWAGLPAPWGPNVKVVKRDAFGDLESVATRLGKLELVKRENDDARPETVLLLGGKEIAASWIVGLEHFIRTPEADLVVFFEHDGGNAAEPPREILALKSGGFERLALNDDKGGNHSPSAILYDDREARFVALDDWGGRLVWTYRDGRLAFAERREGQQPPATLPRQRAAAEAEILPALGEVAVWHERWLGELILARPAIAAKLGQLVPPDFDQCFADNHLYGFERSASGAIVIARSGAHVHGFAKSLIYLHPSGQVHVILDRTSGGCEGVRGDRRPAFYYFTDADPASGRPKEVDEWLANYRDGSERVLWLAGNTVHELMKPVQARAAPPAAAPRQVRPAPRPQAQAAGPRFRSDPACDALRANAERIANSGLPPAVRERQLRMVYGGRAAQHCMR